MNAAGGARNEGIERTSGSTFVLVAERTRDGVRLARAHEGDRATSESPSRHARAEDTCSLAEGPRRVDHDVQLDTADFVVLLQGAMALVKERTERVETARL